MKFMIASILLLGIAGLCCAKKPDADLMKLEIPMFNRPKSCDTTKCSPNCVRITPIIGCSLCSCRKKREIACAPPKCADGCHVNYRAVPCPSCMCPKK